MENVKKSVKEIIKEMWQSGSKQSDIAKALNEAGYTTFMEKPWTQATVSYIALNQLKLENRQIKSSGNPRGPYKGHEVTQSIKGEVFVPEAIEETEEDINNKLALINKAVFIEGDKAFADSLSISIIFNKRHSDVLRDIKNLDCSESFTERNFALSEYKDATGRFLRKYNLTKDGFSFLVFGYKGTTAAEFKERLIEKFNEMEQALKTPAPKIPQNSMQLLETFFGALKETNERIDNIPNLIEEKVNNKISELKESSFKKLNTFPKPLIQVPMFLDPNIDQAETDRLIKEWSTSKGLHPQVVYRALYRVFQAVKKINLYLSAEKAGKSKLTYIADNGMLPDFYAFTYQNLIENNGKYLNQDVEMA